MILETVKKGACNSFMFLTINSTDINLCAHAYVSTYVQTNIYYTHTHISIYLIISYISFISSLEEFTSYRDVLKDKNRHSKSRCYTLELNIWNMI